MDNKPILIISGYNQRGVIAFCRFAVSNHMHFFIVASGEKDSILLSDFKKNVIEIRQSREIKKKDFLLYRSKIESIFKCDEIILFPSSEYLNRFLLAERYFLEKNAFVIPLCSNNLYELLSDKYSFGLLCKTSGILIPEEYYDIESAKPPFVAKPKKYFSNKSQVNQKPHIYYTQDDVRKLAFPDNTNELYYQEFIGGNSFYLLFYFSRNGGISCYSQENLIQQANGLSIIAARSSDVHNDPISTDFSNLLQSQGFTGLIMIEVKLFNDAYYMIEANPRLWGPSQLILDSQMDLFYKFSFDYGLLNELPDMTYKKDVEYFWSGGLIEDAVMIREIVFHNYNGSDFLKEYNLFTSADIYLKEDTIEIYKRENIQ